jgi:hypothetical protein
VQHISVERYIISSLIDGKNKKNKERMKGNQRDRKGIVRNIEGTVELSR